LYGAQSFRKFTAEKKPVIQDFIVEDIKKISCSRCQRVINEIPDDAKIFYVSLADRNISICKGCLKSHVEIDETPLLCVPIQDQSFYTNVKGSIMEYPKKFKTPFYGYKCQKCEGKKCLRYYKCTECCAEGKEKRFCEDCIEELLTNCASKNHAIVLESVPFSFWCERMSEGELDQLRYQDELMINPDDRFKEAKMYFENQQFQKARQYYDMYLQRNEDDPKNPYIAFVYCQIANSYSMEGQSKKALENFFKCVEIKKSVDQTVHPPMEEADAYRGIGTIYYEQGEYKKALEYCEKSLNLVKKMFGEDHVKTGECLNMIAAIYAGQGDYKRALEYNLRDLEILKKSYGYNHPNVSGCYSNLGLNYARMGELPKSCECYWKALEIAKSVHGETHTSVGTAYKNIGELLASNGEFAKALDYYMKAMEIYESTYGANHPNTALCYDSIGCMLISLGELVKGREYLFKSLKVIQSTYGENHISTANPYQNIGNINYRAGAYNEAFEYYSKSIEVRKLVLEGKHPDIANACVGLGKVCHRQGKFEKALENFYEALDIYKSRQGEDNRKKIDRIERKIQKAWKALS